jgi:tetratricopeptide (TPR) repeat protein
MTTARLSRSASPQNRQISRRWCVPPAIMLDPDETLEGSLIFDEFRGRELGLLLWSALRDVMLWATVAEEHRPGLFSAATAEKRLQALVQETSLDNAEQLLLTTLTTVTSTPDTADREIVSLVCTELSKWAESKGASATAIAFAQAASVADDTNALASRRVGMLAFAWAIANGSQWRRQRLARAETWMRRAIAQARRARAWDAYALAYVDLGRLYQSEKKIPGRAKVFFVKAQRAARRHGHLAIRAAALHGLLRVALTQREFEQAEPLAKAALRAYRQTDQPLTVLLQDMAHLWLNTGNYKGASTALRRILLTQADPEKRALTCAMLARSAAGAGEVEEYREAWSDAWLLLTQPGMRTDEDFEAALLELSRAAVTAGDTPRVSQASGLLRQRGGKGAPDLSREKPWAEDSDQNHLVPRRISGGAR